MFSILAADGDPQAHLIWGLHLLDFLILMGFLVAVLAVGVWAARSVKHESDFFLAGRKMGKAFQFFINFGNATDTNAAPTMARQVYTQGVSGMWLQLQTLFITPFFWFTQPWFRRARVITMADMFIDRFNSKSVASAYAVFNIMVALLTLGLGNFGGYSVVEAMMVKPEWQMTAPERQEVAGFHEYQQLLKDSKAPGAELTPQQSQRLTELENLSKKGQLRGRIGVLSKAQFYVGYNAIIAIYIMLGGLKAAAITDAVQGILILVMSVILIPLGLHAVGGFAGLHALVPRNMFNLSGGATSNYTWYSIIAVTFASLIQIIGLQHNMAAAGSATNENAARFGMITGGFTKRVVLILWMLCGLLALAIFSGHFKDVQALSVPEYAWGSVSTYLLPVGMVGLMLSGMLLGHMPAVGLTAVAVSGLVTRNLYEPLLPGKSPKHYLRVGQLVIVFVLAASVTIAWTAHSLEALTAKMILFNTFFGAVVLLMFFWRRLTVPAILISFVFWLIIQLAIPVAVAYTPLHRWEPLTLRTAGSPPVAATAADVAARRAEKVGDLIPAAQAIKPIGVFFSDVALIDPQQPALGYEGVGGFLPEIWIMYYPLRAVGLDMRNFSAADLTTVRWTFCGLFPFFILMVLSLLTPMSAPERADQFYVKQRTPVAPTPEEDRVEVEKSYENPHRFDNKKLFPGTNWEFGIWTPQDYAGFLACWGVVGVILGFLYLVLHLGA